MTGFDFIFALFSLVLGMAITEVLGGFADVMKLHAKARAGRAKDVRVGWLVPLLATLVIINQLQFMMMAYGVRETLPFSYLTLLAVLAIVGGFYLFSAIVFPDDPAEWPDFDAYYDQHNRFILIGMLAINLIASVGSAAFRPPPTPAQMAAQHGDLSTLAALATGAMMLTNVALIFVRGRALNIALLALLITLTVGLAFFVLIAGF